MPIKMFTVPPGVMVSVNMASGTIWVPPEIPRYRRTTDSLFAFAQLWDDYDIKAGDYKYTKSLKPTDRFILRIHNRIGMGNARERKAYGHVERLSYKNEHKFTKHIAASFNGTLMTCPLYGDCRVMVYSAQAEL